MAKKNGTASVEALLEKILAEIQKTNTELADFRRDSNARLDRIDVRLDMMALGYQDLRNRVTGLEKA